MFSYGRGTRARESRLQRSGTAGSTRDDTLLEDDSNVGGLNVEPLVGAWSEFGFQVLTLGFRG